MSQEPYEVEPVEYGEAEPIAPENRIKLSPVVYQSEGLPCCSGCGCLMLTLFVLMFSGSGSLLTGIVILLSATVIATSMLRITGVKRWSAAYAYILVPVFLISLNLTSKVFRHEYVFSGLQLAGATLLIYVFLYLARIIGRP